MAKMANSTVSTSVGRPDHTRMRCYVYVLQNCMKLAFQKCGEDSMPLKVTVEFNSVKPIVEDSKRYGWNKNLPNGHHLKQDVETRFGTTFLVTERFLKSATEVWRLLCTENRRSARNNFESLEQTPHPVLGSITTFPALMSLYMGSGLCITPYFAFKLVVNQLCTKFFRFSSFALVKFDAYSPERIS